MLSPIIASLVLIVDQTFKAYFIRLILKDETIPLVKDIFHITLVYNTGGAFGIFQNRSGFFVAVSVVAIIFLAAFYARLKRKRLIYKIAIPLILGGAASNLVDRLRFGFVIDYLDFRVWPVFNIADASISVGVCLLLLNSFRRK